MFNISKDVYVCSVYIPPENSRYFNPDFLDDFETDVLAFSSMGHVILMDDFNARTSSYAEFI